MQGFPHLNIVVYYLINSILTSLFYNEPTLGFFHYKLLLVVLATKKRPCPQLMWKKPIKSTYWNQMKFDVGHVILEIK